jgi:putative ABC transport system permease protein
MVLVTGVLVGIAASVVAAFVPAVEAAWSSPSAAQRRSLLEQRTRRVLPWIALVGLCLLVAAFGLLRMTAALSLGIAGVFCLLLGYSLLTPWSVSMLISAAAWLTRPRPNRAGGQDSLSPGAISRPADGYASVAVLPRLALRGILGTLSRTGVAVAALTLSVSASIGTGVMVYSFRLAVEEWLDQILQADIYVALPGIPGRASETLPPDMQNRAGALPGVAEVSTGRRVFLETSLGQTETLVLDPAGPNRPGFRFKGKESAQIWRDFMTRDVVLISEPYASRHGLEVGDRIAFATDRGRVELAVGGIFFDYRSDRGIAVLHRHLYDRFWRDEGVSSLGLFLAPGADLSTVKSEVSRVLTGEQPLIVRSNREIRAASLDVFDRTFTVTQVLRLQALAVAFVGILSALLALQTERARDLAILRAIGLTPNQVRVLVLLQTGVLGLCAGMLAAPLGALVGFALVRVINLRSFGWSMDLALPADAFLEALLLAVGAALLAGIYPAWRASRIAPAAALREE